MVIEDEDDTGQQLRFSKRLDVHRWSDHPEVNELIDQIYAELNSSGNVGIRKRHLKVILLDLYVNWTVDPDLRTVYSRHPNDYDAGSIYNELHISRTTIGIADLLESAGYVEQAVGFFNQERGAGFRTRMWPTQSLVELFMDARFSVFDVGYSRDRLAIELRDREKTPVRYEPTSEIRAMLHEMQLYNDLLHRTFISLPSMPTLNFHSEDENSGSEPQFASQHQKFVRRIFNNGSFEEGGRFYGGWWQNCPKALREQILIDDQITIEIDYGSLHPSLLYAREGLDLWSEVEGDPYQIGELSFEKDTDVVRGLAKTVLLIALNSADVTTVPAAFRDSQPTGSNLRRLTNPQVFEVVSALEQKLQPIAGYFSSGIGLELQNTDSRIASRIVNHFTERGAPVLVIHDSFIVQQSWMDELELVMDVAFKEVTNSEFSSRMKFIGSTYDDVMNELITRSNLRYGRGTDEEEAEDMELYREVTPIRHPRYVSELTLFNEWLSLRNNQVND